MANDNREKLRNLIQQYSDNRRGSSNQNSSRNRDKLNSLLKNYQDNRNSQETETSSNVDLDEVIQNYTTSDNNLDNSIDTDSVQTSGHLNDTVSVTDTPSIQQDTIESSITQQDTAQTSQEVIPNIQDTLNISELEDTISNSANALDSLLYTEPVLDLQDSLDIAQRNDTLSVDTTAQQSAADSLFRNPYEDVDTQAIYPENKRKPNYFRDALFDFISSGFQNLVETNVGQILEERNERNDLDFRKAYLSNYKDLSNAREQLVQAQRTGNQDLIDQAYDNYQVYQMVDEQWRDNYLKSIDSQFLDYDYLQNDYVQQDIDKQINRIDAKIANIDKDLETDQKDLLRWQELVRATNRIYTPTQEWEDLKQGEHGWIYQIPSGLASSMPSLVASGLSFAATKALPAAGGYFGGPFGAAAGAYLGLSFMAASTIVSRNQESMAEVSGAYKQKFFDSLDMSLEEYFNPERRQKLTLLTGLDYNDPEVTAEQVLEGYIAYDIALDDPERNEILNDSKKALDDIYQRNMALVSVDMAQNFLIIPGAGKLLKNVFSHSNLVKDLGEAVYWGLDKAVDFTLRKVGTETAKRLAIQKGMKYIVAPIYGITMNGILEGTEEVTQQMIAWDYTMFDSENQNKKWYNPLDFVQITLDNNYAAVKGMMGVMGISSDPALNDSKELSDQFKVGAAIGFIMGGPGQVYEAHQNRKSYRYGRDLGRFMMSEDIRAKDDMYKYVKYAEMAISGKRAEPFLDGIDTQINDELIPTGWTVEDVAEEKNNILRTYNIIQNNKYLNKFKPEDRAIAAALIMHSEDELSRARQSYRSLDSQEFRQAVTTEAEGIANLLGLDVEQTDAIISYYLNYYKAEALSQMIDRVKNSNFEDANTQAMVDLAIAEQEARHNAEQYSEFLQSLGFDPSTRDLNMMDEIKSIALLQFFGQQAINQLSQHNQKLNNDRSYTQECIERYMQAYVDQNTRFTDDNQTTSQNVDESRGLGSSKPRIEAKEDKHDNEDGNGPAPSVTPPTQPAPQSSEEAVSSEKIISDDENGVWHMTFDENGQPTLIWEPKETSEQNSEEAVQPEVPTAEDIMNRQDVSKPELTEENYGEGQNLLTQEDVTMTNEILSSEPEATQDETISPIQEVEVTPTSQTHAEIPEPDNKPVTDNTEEISSTDKGTLPESIVVGNTNISNNDIVPENQEQMVQDGTILTEGTLYYQANENSLLPGHENGKALNEFSSTPGNVKQSVLSAELGEPNSQYGQWDPSDISTWDNAPIYVTITAADGKQYAAALKTIDGARTLRERNGEEFSKREEDTLRQLRNEIISKKLDNPKAKVRFDYVRLSNGQINVNRVDAIDENGQHYQQAVNRNLAEVKGLNLPADLRELHNDDQEIAFAVGMGMDNNFELQVVHPDPGKAYDLGQSINSQNVYGGYGNIFIIPAANSNPSGLQNSAIKLNEKRFADEDSQLADLAAEAVLFAYTRRHGYDTAPLRSLLIFTDWPLIDSGDPRYSIMANKQIKIYKNKDGLEILRYGETEVPLENMQNDNGVRLLSDFIRQNSHWAIDLNNLMTPMRNQFRSYFEKHYDYVNPSSIPNEIELAPGFTITLDDLGLQVDVNSTNLVAIPLKEVKDSLTFLEWLIKNGKIQSDLKDQIYTSPFIYVGNPVVDQNLSEEEKGLISAQNDPIAPEPSTETSVREGLEAKPEESTSFDAEGDLFAGDGQNLSDGFGINDFFKQFGQGAPKISNKEDVMRRKRINTKKAIRWLKSKLGLLDEQIMIVDGFIREFVNGSAVFGVCNADCIGISNLAQEGVQYHEAWHRVCLLLLDPETRRRLYTEFRKQHPQYRNQPDTVVEEALADGFMEFMLNDSQSNFRYFINKIFRNIKKFIGINAKLDPRNLLTFYNAIKYGDFSKYKINKESLAEFVKAYPEDGAYFKIGKNKDYTPTHFPTLYDFHTAINSLRSTLLIYNDVEGISDISSISTDKLKTGLQTLLTKSRFTQNQKDAIQEILDHFDDWMYELKDSLKQVNIRQIDQQETEDFKERETTGIQNYDKPAYAFDRKANALGVVKMFFSTIKQFYWQYKEVDGTLQKVAVIKTDDITGLPRTIDYDTIATKVLNRLSSVETYHPVSTKPEDVNNSLVGRCYMLAKDDADFYSVYIRLSQIKDSNLETQILQTVKSANLNPIEVLYATDRSVAGTFYVKDSTIKAQERGLPTQWSSLFFNSPLIDRTNNSISVNKGRLQKVLKDFNDLQKSFFANRKTLNEAQADVYKNKLVCLLNIVGINIEENVLDALLGEDKINGLVKHFTKAYNRTDLISSIFENTLGKLLKSKSNIQLDQLFVTKQNESIFNALARAQIQVSPINNELSVLGPNNNLYCLKVQNNYCSDLVRWLNSHDTKTLNKLNNDTYCKSSIILGTINNGSPIKLNTLINFYGLNSQDRGRAYTELYPIEDYVMKMALTRNNHIIFPTMADKGTWNTITGVQLFNDPTGVKFNGGKYMFSRRLLAQLYRYWLDEFETIVNYWKSLPEVPAEERIDNYHTKNRGGLFRHFTGYYDKDLKTYVNLNDNIRFALKERGQSGVLQVLEEIRKDLFADGRTATTMSRLDSMMMAIADHEIDKAVKIGLISSPNKRVYKNELLDKSYLNHLMTEVYVDMPKDSAESFAIYTMIGNFAANQMVSTIEIEKIFSGDVAFYKSTDDQIKRYGALLSTGDNMRTDWHTNSKDKKVIKDYKYLNSRQTYTCTVLKDNNIQSQQYETIKQLFTQAQIRTLLKQQHGLSEAEIDELFKTPENIKQQYPDVIAAAESLGERDARLYGLSEDGRGNVNQADAAVYIRPQMYKDIARMLGEWNRSVKKAFEILESAEDWLSDPELYQKSLKTLIKALKTTYFGYTYNDRLKHNVPVYNKMAMFPLFKVLATGDNRELYDRMNAVGKYEGLQPIDQAAFESAVKVGAEGKSKFYKDVNNEEINDLTNLHTTVQEFRNLRRQLNTDPHHSERQLFGTQVSTVAVSNLIEDRIYGENKPEEQRRTGAQLKDQLFNCINALSDKGLDRAMNKYRTNGELDWQKVSTELKRVADTQNMDREFREALELNEDKDGLRVPISALPNNRFLESSLISTFNKEAVDIELPGGAFIQMSSFAVKRIGVEGSRLLFIRDDGSMDAIISINLFSHIIPDYNKLSFQQARQWLIDHDLIGDNASTVAVGYRIPTQGLSSVVGLHTKDVLPSNVGDLVILPDEFTAQTGSDFDIDKLYIARYNYDKNGKKIPFIRWRNGEDEYKNNSREAVENLLLDTYMLVLTDNKNIGETRLALDKVVNMMKDEILPIIDGKSSVSNNIPFQELSPSFWIDKKYEFLSGKRGLGPFALNNKNHVLTQLVHLKFKPGNVYLEALDFKGIDGIQSRTEIVLPRDKYGEVTSDTPYTDYGMNILDWVSAMISVHVDVAKDSFVIRLNANAFTYNLYNFLLRAGYGKNAFYFMCQPIIKELAVAYQNAQGVYGSGTEKASVKMNKSVEKIIKKYYNLYSHLCQNLQMPINEELQNAVLSVDPSEISELMSRDTLINNILLQHHMDGGNSLNDLTLVKFYEQQLSYLQMFFFLNDLSQDLSKLVQLSQIDTERYGNSFVDQDRFQYRMKSLVNNTSLFDGEELKRYYSQTFLLTKAVNGMVRPSELFENSMLRSQRAFKNAVSRVLIMVGRQDVSDDQLTRRISNELEGQIRWRFLSTKLPDSFIYDMLYGQNSMSQRLSKLKSDILDGKYSEMLSSDGKITNRLLEHLTSLPKFSTENYDAPAIIGTNRVGQNDQFLKKDLKLYWQELLSSEHQEIRKFATDLFYYQLATTSGNLTKNGIWDVVPITLIMDSGFANYMLEETQKFSEDSVDFDNFFLNNWHDDKLVPSLERSVKRFDSTLQEMVDVNAFPQVNGKVKIGNQTKLLPVIIQPNLYSIGRNAQKTNIFTPYVKIVIDRSTPEGVLLYKFVGVDNDNKPIYALVNKKGLNRNGRVVKEYDEYSDSSLPFNNFEGALAAKSLSQNDLIQFAHELIADPVQRRNWENIFSQLALADDYIPQTTALNTSIEEFADFSTGEDSSVEIIQAQPQNLSQSQQDPNIEKVFTDPNVPQSSTFKFKDGFSIDLPFTLNSGQQNALWKLEEFVKDPSKFDNRITLCGYAGTGKTTIIGIFKQYLDKKYLFDNIVFSAPTHRANMVTAQNIKNGKISTLASLFGINPLVDVTDASQIDYRKTKDVLRKSYLKDNSLLIIDESSMISQELYDVMINVIKQKELKRIAIIFMGDDAQLGPVNSKKPTSPVFDGIGKSEIISLNQVMRTGENAILAESTRLRSNPDFSYRSTGNVEFTNSENRLDDIIASYVTSKSFISNPFYFRILSATNADIPIINRKVRKLLFGDNARPVEVGDIMMGYSNRGEFQNGVDYTVTEVSELKGRVIEVKSTTRKIYGYEVTLKNSFAQLNKDSSDRDRVFARPIKTFIVDIDETNSMDDSVINDIINYEADLRKQLNEAWSKYDRGKISLLEGQISYLQKGWIVKDSITLNGRLVMPKTVDYAYAHTIHKSQGGTYNNVLIYGDTIEKFPEVNQRQQLRYVAVSRAKDEVTIFTKHPIESEVEYQPSSIAEEWSKKEGWSVQKFERDVLPLIEKGEAYQIEFEYVPADQVKTKPKGKAQSVQEYEDMRRPGVKSSNTFDAIISGERTATTRHKNIDWWNKFKVGDLLIFYTGEKNTPSYRELVVRITKPMSKLTLADNTTTSKFVSYGREWNRKDAESDPRTLFIFTDNTDRTSGSNLINSNSKYAKMYGATKRYPNTTQAVVRGLDNAMPISTQHYFNVTQKGKSGRWIDSEFDEFKSVVDTEIENIKREWDTGKYDRVVYGTGDGFFDSKISGITKDRTPNIYDYLKQKIAELENYINGNNAVVVPRDVVKTHDNLLAELGGVDDPIAQEEVRKTVEVAKKGLPYQEALSDVVPIFTAEEIAQIKQALGGKNLQVKSASRYTDPVFLADKLIEQLKQNFEKPFTDPSRINVIEIWTKHDGEPLERILKACKDYKVAPMVSFSITSLGNTPMEKGVLEYNTLLKMIEKLIQNKELDPRTSTIRIDPILVGYTNMEDIKVIVRKCKKMGFKKFVTSLVQSYGYLDGTNKDRYVTTGINTALQAVGQTYDWDKYYGRDRNGNINFIPKKQYIDEVGKVLLELNTDPDIDIQTCAFQIEGLRASACLDPDIIEAITGISVRDDEGNYQKNTSRKFCFCYGCSSDMFAWNDSCYSSCGYCYAGKSKDDPFQYYDDNGNLINRPLTRVNGEFIGNPKNYALYTGTQIDGSFTKGGDYNWMMASKKYNIGTIVGFGPKHMDKLTDSQRKEVEDAYQLACNHLKKTTTRQDTVKGKLIRRDYLQMKSADQIFAVGQILKPGETENNPGKKWLYTNRTDHDVVAGGTGYAVQMAMDKGKPIHMFDQRTKSWYIFDYGKKQFVQEDTPTLSINFAGIGTREISQESIAAIDDVFRKTFGVKSVSKPNTVNVWSTSGEYKDLSNFAVRPFTDQLDGNKFNSVEQAFHYYKLAYSDASWNEVLYPIAQQILNTTDGAKLKKLGKSIPQFDSVAWDRDSENLMKQLIKQSFEQNPNAASRLKSLRGVTITHNNPTGKTDKWTTLFPKLLMEVRDGLIAEDEAKTKVMEQQPKKTPRRSLTEFSTFDNSQIGTATDNDTLNDLNNQTEARDYCVDGK